ncbi:hypothetical protein KXX68_008401, partial [Aspergillus fumigatus]
PSQDHHPNPWPPSRATTPPTPGNGAPPPLPILADDDSTRDDGLLAQVALAQLLVEFQQAQTARPLGVKDRRVKQVELSLGYRMLQYRWNTSKD